MTGCLLITRPAPDGEILQQALQQRGWRCQWQPLIAIRPGPDLAKLPHTLSQLTRHDHLIAVSKHAVTQAQQALIRQGADWPLAPHYLAVGKRTAALWQSYCQSQVVFPQREDSEGLLSLPQLAAPAGRRVVILRGQSGRELLADELRQRGAEVSYIACYQRQALALDGKQLSTQWKQTQVEFLLISSGEMLQQMLMLAENEQLWLKECGLIVVSQRIAEMAQNAGFKKIIVSKGVTPQAIDEALHRLIKV